jgi:hypothetical protein
MSTPPQDPPGGAPVPRFDDPTRDIRRPSAPDRPPADVRPERPAHVRPHPAPDRPSPASEAPEPRFPAPTAAPSPIETVSVDPASTSVPPRPYVLPNEPTDELPPPPRQRQQTLAFDAPPGGVPGPVPNAAGSPAPGQGVPQFGAAPSASAPYGPPAHGAPSYGPAGQGAPAPPHGVPAPRVAAARERRWPWVVLILLTLLVIVGAGLLLLLLLGGI